MRPPDGVKMVIEAVCIMKSVKPKKVAGDKVGQYCAKPVWYIPVLYLSFKVCHTCSSFIILFIP